MAAVAGRAVGLAFLLWATFRVLAHGLTLGSSGVVAFLHGVNLVFHEAGHVIFGFLGEFIAVAGGSLNQVLIPAIYAADGRTMALPRLAEGLIHDWNYLLGRLSLLPRAETIGRAAAGAPRVDTDEPPRVE
jgi:hypothetical protein